MTTSQVTFPPGAATTSLKPSRKTPARGPTGAPQGAGVRRSRGRPTVTIFLALLWIVPVGIILAWGLEYYLTPIAERGHSELHDLFKPSGTIGLGLGVVGTVFMVLGVGMYGLRKRVRFLERLGELGIWLQLHIYLCTLGPVLILLHTGFRIGGLVSIGFWCMMIVAVTGFFGRYIYAHIPGKIHGESQSLQSLRAEQERLVETIKKDFGAQGKAIEQVLITQPRRHARGFLHALFLIMSHALRKRRRLRKIKKLMPRKASRRSRNVKAVRRGEQRLYLRNTLIGLVRRQVELEQRIVLLEPFQMVFKFWHIMHIPLTIVMFVIVAAHIAVAILLGYTWIF